MADIYRNQLVASYPTYSQTLAQVNAWDLAHQQMFEQQMQVLLDSMNSTAKITPADAADINQHFVEMYHEALAKNRDLNIQRYDALAEQAQNIEQLQDAYEHTQELADAAQQSIADSMQTRYGQTMDKKRQKAGGVKYYMWITMGDNKVRDSHEDREGEIYSWDDYPAPGDEPFCRCSALPVSFIDKDASGEAEKKPESDEDTYDPEEDELYMLGYYIWGQIAALDLGFHNKLIEEHSKAINKNGSIRQIDSALIKGVITNEIITRLGASGGDAVMSGFRSLFNDRGNGGTYGPGQLGREAREAAGLSILDSLTYEGAIRGAANWLDMQRQDLVKMGIQNPTNAQIATRYNKGSARGEVTNYGIRVQFLIDRLYSGE